MDFFEFLFGKKEDKNVSSQSSSSVVFTTDYYSIFYR